MLPSDAIVIVLQYAVPEPFFSGGERAPFLRTRGVSRAWREAHAAFARRGLAPPPHRCRRRGGRVSRRWCLDAAGALFGGDVAELLRWAVRDVALLDPRDVRAHGAQFGPPCLMDTGDLGVSESAELLPLAASGGHAEAVEWLAERFAEPGLRAGSALRVAAGMGHVNIVDRLGRAPFWLGERDAQDAFEAAVRGGSVAVLERLLAPPYGAARERFETVVLQGRAAYFGHVPMLGRLMEPPFLVFGHTANWVLNSACVGGRHEVLDHFAHLANGLTPEERGGLVVAACSHSHGPTAVRVLNRLALPPFSMGHADALRNDGAAFAEASCVEVLGRLGTAPYAPPGPLPNPGRVLDRCAYLGCTRMLDRLAQPPFSLDHRHVTEGLRREAAQRGVCLGRRLKEPPFAAPERPPA